jgi:hypothetical protein
LLVKITVSRYFLPFLLKVSCGLNIKRKVKGRFQERSTRMDREQFMDLMLTDQKIFARYARLFMDLGRIRTQGFLDWAWERYRDGARSSTAKRQDRDLLRSPDLDLSGPAFYGNPGGSDRPDSLLRRRPDYGGETLPD